MNKISNFLEGGINIGNGWICVSEEILKFQVEFVEKSFEMKFLFHISFISSRLKFRCLMI